MKSFAERNPLVIGTVGILLVGVLLIGLMGAARPRVKPQAPVITPPSVFYVTAEPAAVTLDVYAHFVERTELQVELVAVGRAIVERNRALPCRSFQRLAEEREEPKRVCQVQRPVVAEIVAEKPIRHRGLRRNALERAYRQPCNLFS